MAKDLRTGYESRLSGGGWQPWAVPLQTGIMVTLKPLGGCGIWCDRACWSKCRKGANLEMTWKSRYEQINFEARWKKKRLLLGAWG